VTRPTITLRVTTPRLWQGNGFGHAPAEYALFLGTERLGTVSRTGLRGWEARVGPERITAFDGRLASLRALLRERFAENSHQ
jgi:hypothetical protein